MSWLRWVVPLLYLSNLDMCLDICPRVELLDHMATLFLVFLRNLPHSLPQWLHQFPFLLAVHAAAAKSLQSCPTLCDPVDGSPPGSPVPGILRARTPEWAAISFSSARKWEVKVKSLSRVQLLATPWTAAHQAPPSMGLSRQEHWSGVPSPSPDSAWGSLFLHTLSSNYYL